MKLKKIILTLSCLSLSALLSCSSSNNNTPPPDASVGGDTIQGVVGPSLTTNITDPSTYRGAGVIQDPRFLIGGPLAQGRVGDVLLQNDKIRVIIQKPRRNAGVPLYGGNIIDGDITRAAGEKGHDQWGILFPQINVSWTPFYQKLEVINGDLSQGPAIVRATGVLDVYDYIQTSIIVPFAKVVKGATLFFPAQYNDILNPFQNLPELRGINQTIVTDYILRPDKNYVMIQTHIQNNGSTDVKMPFGDWVNSSGTLETFIPKIGYTGQGIYPSPTVGAADNPALVYPGMETNVGVSYAYSYDPDLIKKTDGSYFQSQVLTVSGVSVVALGETIATTGIIPFNDPTAKPKINFAVKPGENVFTRYFSIGNGDVGSALGGSMDALAIDTQQVSGNVKDASGQNVAAARVTVFDTTSKKPVSVFYSDAQGNFSGNLSGGADPKAQLFGSGHYRFEVYKEGYLYNAAAWTEADSPSLKDKKKAGVCPPATDTTHIQCNLGESGLVQVTAQDPDGHIIPARIGIVGFDPSPYHKLPNAADPSNDDDSSIISDIEFQAQQYGYIDSLFLDPQGKISNVGHARFVHDNVFRLEPGTYDIYLMRGPEYSQYVQRITVTNGGTNNVSGTLRKVVDTTGYVGADFHIHGINSPDSPFGQQARVNFALAEGLDLMVSADHDAITDYSVAIHEMGLQDYVASIPGMEITPMAFGHFIAFPLLFNADDPTGGAFDYTKKEGYSPGPSHHELLSPEELLTQIDAQNPGEQVLQVNHIMDNTLGNFSLSRLVTTTYFEGVPPLSTFSDPVDFRLSPNNNSAGNFHAPFPYGTNKLFTDKFTSLEICIGESAVVPLPHVMETSLPTWFNFLNLGKIATATCSSDTHRQIREPIGILRNYVQSSVDPRDGQGTFSAIDPQEIAHNVNHQKVIVSAGPFMKVSASSDTQTAGLGDTLTFTGAGPKTVNLQIQVSSPDWMDWDTVEVYVNTDPIPAKDDLSGPWDKSAEDFVTVTKDMSNPAKNHLNPKFIYSPTLLFKRGGGAGIGAIDQQIADGKRSAQINTPLTLNEDSWIVVMVKGSSAAKTIFPYAPKAVNTQTAAVSPANFLETLKHERENEGVPDLIGGSKAFAFSNPIFVDVDGDGFKAKYVRSGVSPLR
ncbi:MAG: CehA/McbA family metallohydrolase [Deltaproteobacteria bacterium]|nr:CehA/McbA family metallohydrolase [Deltaproteobacteria bacterium]